MSIVIIDSFDKENSIGEILKNMIKDKKQEVSYHRLREMDIKRCKACGACTDKTPGQCVINDDMQQVFKDIAKSEYLIMLTTIKFGGYSSRLKLAVDRFMVLGLPFYYVKDGALFHRTRYGHKNYIVIGLAEENISGQEENFINIVMQNAANLSYSGKALIFKPSDDVRKIENELAGILAGGNFNE